jgi:hypothetical protein
MTAPSRTRDLAWLVLLSMAATAAVLSSRGRQAVPEAAAVPTPLVSMDSLAPEPAPPPSAPRPRETQDAVRRVFGDTVTVDERRAVAGDFNGDGAEDLAIVARPAKGALARVNHDLANWTLQDALAMARGGSRARPTRVALAEGDVVLAVIHGYGAAGWRDPRARQSYLVRHAVGDSLATRAMREAARGLAGAEAARLRGDVIAESIGGRPGFLYWSGVRYLWFPRPPAAAGP